MEKKKEALLSDTSGGFIILISPSFLSNLQVILRCGLFIIKLFILTSLLHRHPPHTHAEQNLTVFIIYVKGSVGSLSSRPLPLQSDNMKISFLLTCSGVIMTLKTLILS